MTQCHSTEPHCMKQWSTPCAGEVRMSQSAGGHGRSLDTNVLVVSAPLVACHPRMLPSVGRSTGD